MAVCGRCGTQHDGSSVFCPACGAVQTPTGQSGPQSGQQPQVYGQPDPYGQYGQTPPAGGYGAPAWGTPPPPAQPWSTGSFSGPPPPPPPLGGWTSQAPPQPGGWGGQGQYDQDQYASAPVGPPPERPRDPKLLLLVLGVVGIVVVAGVIAFLLLNRRGSDTTAAVATTSSAAPSTSTATPSRKATATPTGGVQSVTGTPEAQPAAGSALSLGAAGADCTYPPSVDGNNQPVTYEPQKAVDGDPTTAWRCPGAGGHTIELHGTGLASDLGLIPGYAKVDPATGVNRFTDNHTVTQVIWRLRHGTTTVQIVQDIQNPTPQMAWIHLPGTYSFDDITVTVTGTGNPTARQDSTPISDIAVWGSS